MQRVEKEIPLNCEIVFMGDTHGGSLLTHYRGIKKIVNYIQSTKMCYWCHLGDWIEAIATDDKRFNRDTCRATKGKPIQIPQEQADEMIKLFSPIKGRGIVGLMGNHELKLYRYSNLAEYICRNLGITYGTMEARVIFKNSGKRIFSAFLTHRIRMFRIQAKDYIQANGNIQASLKQQLYKRMGDCAVMVAGHAHQLIVVPPSPELYLVDSPDGIKQHYLTGDMGDGGYIYPNRRWYCCSGSFRKRYVDGVDDYADIYDPNEMGCLIMVVRNGEIKDIKKFKV